MSIMPVIKRCLLTLLCLLVLVSAGPAFAQVQSPVMEGVPVVAFPGLTDREALVELEFTVASDGSTRDFQAVGGFHEPRFVEASIAAVNTVTFRPATENGEPVDWPNYRVTARFIIEDLFNTIQPGFSSDIRKVEDLLAAQELAAAEVLALEVLDNRARYFFEFTYINLRLSEIYLLQGRLHDAALASFQASQTYLPGEHDNYGLESAKLLDSTNVLSVNQFSSGDIFNDIDVTATLQPNNSFTQPIQTMRPPHLRSGLRYSNQGSDLGDKPTMDVLNARLMQDAMQAAIQIHARLGHVRAMQNDFTRFEAVNPRLPAFLSNIRDLVDQSLAQGGPLQSQQRIDNGQAVYFPLRRAFTLANVEGTVTAMDFYCERRTIRLDFQTGSEWQIPASWGDCALRFLGTDDTEFSVIEFQ